MTQEDVIAIAAEIDDWQGAPWNGGGMSMDRFPMLQKLFHQINSVHTKPPYAYQGRLYRIHCPHIDLIDCVDFAKERVVSKPCSDGSCRVLPFTQFSDKTLAAFSKSPDFTKGIYYKVYKWERAVFLVADTGLMCGIDVMGFLNEYGVFKNKFADEQEVTFPVLRSKLVREYWCTPNQFKYYMRGVVV